MHVIKKKVFLEACDGSPFPGRGPTAFPCNRMAVCPDCRLKTCYRKTDSWFCFDCRATPATFVGIYGHAIGTPRDNDLCRDVSRLLPAVNGKPRLREIVIVRPLGAPVLEDGTNHDPAKDYQEFLEMSALKPALTWLQQQKKIGAEHLLDMFTEAALSSGQQKILIKGLNKMQTEKIIKTEHDVKIFGQPNLLVERAERGGDGNSFGSTPTTYYLDSSALLQGQDTVSVVLLNPLHTLQRIILKKEIPDSALYIGDGEYLSFQNDGANAVGGQVYQNQVYRDRCETFPKENGKFAVAIASDKLLASGRTSYPVYLLLLNVNSAFAMLACELLGFFPVANRRRPHGGKPERFSREQGEAYMQIDNDSTALTLKLFEEVNRQGGARFRLKDGSIRKFNIFVLSLSEDIEGKVPKAVVPKNWCFRCFNGNKHFGSSESFHVCGEGPLGNRTPINTFNLLIVLLQNQSVKMLPSETDKRATSLGMKHFKVVNQLLAFTQCFGEEGVYAALNYDDLHMLFLGLFVLILSAADILFCRHFKRTKLVQTYEDVHQLVEFLLSMSPGMNDGVHILKPMRMGWFRLESWNGVDNECFFSHLLFIFSTHDSLIENGCIRMAFATIVRTLYSLYVRFKVKKFYRAAELEQLSADISAVLKGLQTLFHLSVDDSKDTRIGDEMLRFRDQVPLRAMNKFHKAEAAGFVRTAGGTEDAGHKKTENIGKRRINEGVIDKSVIPLGPSRHEDRDDDDSVDQPGSDEEQEPEGLFTVNVSVNELAVATLGGHQTRTHKCHAFTMIPKHILRFGSLDVGSTRLFETKHKLVKAYTGRSNRLKLGAVEGQVIKNSITSQFVEKPLSSVKARLYREEHAIRETIGEHVTEESDDEEKSPEQFTHYGPGDNMFFIFK